MNRRVLLGALLIWAGFTSSTAWAGPDHTHVHSHAHLPNDQSPTAIARHLQRSHHFDEAAQVLAAYLHRAPYDTAAQLLFADVLRHAGRYDESRSACARVAITGATTMAGFCAVQILVDTQEFVKADEYGDRLAKQIAHLPDSAQIWALEISAEAAWRAGNLSKARRLYQAAIAFDKVPHSTLDAYSEFLTEEKLASTP